MKTSKNGKPGRILVVAEDQQSRSIIKRSLQGLELSLDFVMDGQAALERCAQASYDLVIVWLKDAVASHLYFVQLLKLRRPGLPVVVISKPLSMVDLATVFRWGVSDCLAPNLARDLAARIAGYMSPSHV